MVAFHSSQHPADPESFENNWDAVRDTARRWKLSYPVAYDKKAVLFNKYGGRRWPTVVVLDRQGVIRFYQAGHDAPKSEALKRFLDVALSQK
jgi:hypothetical protein